MKISEITKKNLRTIINAFGENEYVDIEDILKKGIVDCNRKELKQLLLRLKTKGYIEFVEGSFAEFEVSLPIFIRQTDKLRNEKKDIAL